MFREALLFRARLNQKAQRFDEMVLDMNQVARLPQELTMDERNLLAEAYSNAISSRRNSLQVIRRSIEQYHSNSINHHPKEGGDNDNNDCSTRHKLGVVLQNYQNKIMTELAELCHEITETMEDSLIPNSTSNEARVFYYKMLGDCYRYLSECQVDDARQKSAQAAQDSYQIASRIAATTLPPSHPFRLCLALNFSLYYYDVGDSPEMAIYLAKKAFEDAIVDLENLKEDCYKGSTLIMQQIRENLTIWTNDYAQA